VFGPAHANALAYLAMIGFVPVAFLVFRALPAPTAAVALLLGADMFLPADLGLDLPGLPSLGKDALSFLTVFVCVLVYEPRRFAVARPFRSVELLGVVLALGGVVTVFLNGDPLQYGPTRVEAMSPSEAPTAAIFDLLVYAVPFLLGRTLVRDGRGLERLLVAWATAGLLYSLLCLVEMRLSPQLHYWVYGYFPFAFDQNFRWGGFRPVVFMSEGLAAAIFMASALTAAATLARAGIPVRRFSARPIALYLAVLLLACKSLASMLIGIAAAASLVLQPRTAARIAFVVCLLATLYPALRLADLVPTQGIVQLAETIDPIRARSMGGRLESEGKMLEKARERFVFGWGTNVRNWVFDPVTGENVIQPDGYWILRLGSRGLVGFAASFGLCLVPVAGAWARLGRVERRRDRILLVGLMLLIAIRMVDWIPNGRWTSLPVFLAGALYGSVRTLSSARSRAPAHASPVTSTDQQPRR
jgi:hypothetical protein